MRGSGETVAFGSLQQLQPLSCYRGGEKKEESQKIDDLLVLATCQSGTLAMLSSKVNSSVAHGSTRKCLIRPVEAVD